MLMIFPVPQTVFYEFFADDICLVINSLELSTLENVMNEDLASVYKWLQANKLQLNPAKSYYTIVVQTIHAIPFQNCLTLNDTKTLFSSNVKYVGVHIDPQLNFY